MKPIILALPLTKSVLLWTAGALLLAAAVLISLLLIRAKKKKAVPAAEDDKQTQKMRLFASASSLQGDRDEQEDVFFCGREGPNGCLGLVCDGMGGMEGGREAAEFCAELVSRGFYGAEAQSEENMCALLKMLALEADKAVAELENARGRVLSCGTTLAAAAVKDGRAYWLSVGDSRIYHIHEGRVEQLSRDHNLHLRLMEAQKQGKVSSYEAENHPQRDALISYVGRGGGLIIDTGSVSFEENSGDTLLLCSDGLYRTMGRRDIAQCLKTCARNNREPAPCLTESALRRGSIKHDNITALCFYYRAED